MKNWRLLVVVDVFANHPSSSKMSFTWLKYWCEGFFLLAVILIGTAANFFSVIIIRNRELSLVQVNDSFCAFYSSTKCNFISIDNSTAFLLDFLLLLFVQAVDH